MFVFHKTHTIHHLESSQSCRLVKSMNVFEKEKRSCPFSSSKPRPKKGKKAFSCESAADLASSDKGSFYNQDEWLQEIEEYERKPDTSEKQSVE